MKVKIVWEREVKKCDEAIKVEKVQIDKIKEKKKRSIVKGTSNKRRVNEWTKQRMKVKPQL